MQATLGGQVAGRLLRRVVDAVDATSQRAATAPAAYAWTVERRRPKHLVLILAREFASNLATPTLIADAEGRLVFYNEAAEEIVGRPFSEVGEVPVDEWTARFEPRTRETEPLPPERRPVRMALNERRAAHTSFVVTSGDGVEREIAVTAFPLFAHADEFVGIVGIFWREMP
jgi:PAS domain-containing protein